MLNLLLMFILFVCVRGHGNFKIKITSKWMRKSQSLLYVCRSVFLKQRDLSSSHCNPLFKQIFSSHTQFTQWKSTNNWFSCFPIKNNFHICLFRNGFKWAERALGLSDNHRGTARGRLLSQVEFIRSNRSGHWSYFFIDFRSSGLKQRRRSQLLVIILVVRQLKEFMNKLSRSNYHNTLARW